MFDDFNFNVFWEKKNRKLTINSLERVLKNSNDFINFKLVYFDLFFFMIEM